MFYSFQARGVGLEVKGWRMSRGSGFQVQFLLLISQD